MAATKDPYFKITYNAHNSCFEIADPSVNYTSIQAIEIIAQFHNYVHKKIYNGIHWRIGDDPIPNFATIKEIEEMNKRMPTYLYRRTGRPSYGVLSRCHVIDDCINREYECNGLCGSDDACMYRKWNEKWKGHYEIVYDISSRRVQLLVFLHSVNTEQILPWLPGNRMQNLIKMLSLPRYRYLVRLIETFI